MRLAIAVGAAAASAVGCEAAIEAGWACEELGLLYVWRLRVTVGGGKRGAYSLSGCPLSPLGQMSWSVAREHRPFLWQWPSR